MLRLLSGKVHKVTTGITIKSNKNEKIFDSTKVVFKVLTDKEIKYYVKTTNLLIKLDPMPFKNGLD